MRNLSFRGYAQRGNKGFNPLRIPDQSERILRESQRVLEGMSRVQQAEIQNRREVLGAMKENSYKEQHQRDRNFSLQKQFAEAYQKAELQNIQVKIDDAKRSATVAEIRGKEQAAARKQLAALIPKAFAAAGEFQQRRVDEAQKVAANVIADHGLTLEQSAYFDQIQQSADSARAGTQSLKHKYGGLFTNEQILAIDELSGLQKLEAHKLLGKRYGTEGLENYYNSTFQNMDLREFGYPGTVRDALADTTRDNTALLRSAWNAMEVDFVDKLKDSEGNPLFTPEFIAKYVKPHMNEKEDAFNSLLYTKQSEFTNRKQETASAIILEGKLAGTENKGKAFHDAYMIGAGLGKDKGYDPTKVASSRRSEIRRVNNLLKSGKMKSHEFYEIVDYVPEGRTTSLGTDHPEEFAESYKIINERAKLDEQAHDTLIKDVSTNVQSQIFQFRKSNGGQPITKNMLDQLKASITANGLNWQDKEFSYLKDIENMEEMEEREAMTWAEDLYLKGDLTEFRLYGDPRIPRTVIDKYKDKAIDSIAQLPNKGKGYMTTLKKKIIGMGKYTPDLGGSDEKTAHMENMAVERFRRYYHSEEGRAKHAYPEDRAAYARDKVIEEIDKGKDVEGNMWHHTMLGGWQYPGAKQDHEEDTFLRKKIEENPESVYEKNALTSRQKEHLERYARTGKVPQFVRYIENTDITKSSFDIISKLNEKHGLGLKLVAKGTDKVPQYVTEKWRRDVVCMPSLAKAYRAVCGTTVEVNSNANNVGTGLSVLESRESHVTNPGKAHNTADTPQGKINTDNSQAKVSELVTAARLGQMGNFGLYETSGEWLDTLMTEGVFDEDTYFGEEEQRYCAYLKMCDDTSTFRIEGGEHSGIVIPGLGRPSSLKSPPFDPAWAVPFAEMGFLPNHLTPEMAARLSLIPAMADMMGGKK